MPQEVQNMAPEIKLLPHELQRKGALASEFDFKL